MIQMKILQFENKTNLEIEQELNTTLLNIQKDSTVVLDRFRSDVSISDNKNKLVVYTIFYNTKENSEKK